jgi:hypothetical protein
MLAEGGDALVATTLLRKPPTPAEFLAECSIEDKDSGSLIPFKLWPSQAALLDDLADAERLFGLKARQLGWTWVVLGYLLYLGTFWGHRLFLIASQSGGDAQAATHRLKIMHDSLPEKWRQPVVKDNTTELVFANGSRYESMMATKRAGRSRAAYAALADEFAFWQWPEEQMAALEAACARLFAVTTGNGAGDYTHKLWQNAQAGRGRWQTVFHPWSARPDRTPDWYRVNVTEATEPRLARREFAATAEEAFASPEGVFFERFSYERNTDDVLPMPNWQTVRCVDFGYRHPACAWIQTSPAGQPFVVAELAPADMTTDEFAAAIKRTDASLGLKPPPRVTYCDPAGNAANVQTATSEVQILRAAGLNPLSRASSIRDGCVRLMGLLADPAIPLVVSRSCPWLVEAFGAVRPDKHRPDLYDESSEYTHILDALRYWAVNTAATTPVSAPVCGGKPITSGLVGMRF